MKIIFSTYDHLDNPYYAGGGARTIHEIAKRLVTRYDVEVITGNFNKKKRTVIDGVKYRYIGHWIGGPQVSQLLFQFLLPFYAKTHTFDVWIESFTPPYSTAFLPLFTSKPVIGLTQLLGGRAMSVKYKLPFHIIERMGLRFYKQCIVLTDALQSQIKEQNPRVETVVIPNGINTETEVNVQSKNNHILFLGRIENYQKGLDTLIEAYNQVKNTIKLPLIIAGSGISSDIAWLKAKIHEYGLEERVILTGHVEGREKEALLQDAAFVLMPSRYESFGIVILESFARNNPVIISDLKDLNWVPDKHCIRIEPENVHELAQQMEKLATDKQLLHQMKRNIHAFTKQFDWDMIAKRYAEYIEYTISRSKNLS